jgi:hypothetical protein
MATRLKFRPPSAPSEYRRLQGLLLDVIGAYAAIPDPAKRRVAAQMRRQIKTLSCPDVQIVQANKH